MQRFQADSTRDSKQSVQSSVQIKKVAVFFEVTNFELVLKKSKQFPVALDFRVRLTV